MLPNIFGQNKTDKNKIAKMLKTNPELLEKLEEQYKQSILTNDIESDNLFDINAKQASEQLRTKTISDDIDTEYINYICVKITNELLSDTKTKKLTTKNKDQKRITNENLNVIPKEFRPQLTGDLAAVDVNAPSSMMLLDMLYRSLNTKNAKKSKMYYDHFRQGLDILDLDPITYEILGMNRNSIEHWFASLKAATANQGFFKIPETKIAKVPLPILQLTRLDYSELTPSTLKIVDDWAMKTFDLDINKSYFIKTGTYSSKFDFRNQKVTGEKEVQELGEYLLYIHYQANQMAAPLSSPCIYGVSTTNHWVVREFIEDKENNPTIYKGLPLHTEYRVFADMDTKETLGITPYWEPEIMKKRFSENRSIHDTHDYITFQAHEEVLMKRYNDNKEKVLTNLQEVINQMDLKDQWSIDIMQNGDDFYIIDMALADNSAFNHIIASEKRKKAVENWIPPIFSTNDIETKTKNMQTLIEEKGMSATKEDNELEY